MTHTIKVPVSQAEELLEWIALRQQQPLCAVMYYFERGSPIELPSGAKLYLRETNGGKGRQYFISGYAANASDVTIYEPLQDYDMDVMDFMYGLARERAYTFGGNICSSGLY